MTRFHGAGAFTSNNNTVVPIAFVIASPGSTVHVVGQFADNTPTSSLVDQSFQVQMPGNTVGNRQLFYNNSAYDGNDPAANAADDTAAGQQLRRNRTHVMQEQLVAGSLQVCRHRATHGAEADETDIDHG